MPPEQVNEVAKDNNKSTEDFYYDTNHINQNTSEVEGVFINKQNS